MTVGHACQQPFFNYFKARQSGASRAYSCSVRLAQDYGRPVFLGDPRTNPRCQRHRGCHRRRTCRSSAPGPTSSRSARFTRRRRPASTSIPHRQIFHCFGCHKGGDVFAFVKEYENIDFPGGGAAAGGPRQDSAGVREERRRAAVAASQGTAAADPRADRPALAKRPGQRSRRPDRPRLPRQTRRVRRSGEALPPGLRAGLVGRHGELGEEQRPRARPGGAGRPDPAQAGGRRLLRPLPRAADVPHLRRAGAGDRLQRAGSDRR